MLGNPESVDVSHQMKLTILFFKSVKCCEDYTKMKEKWIKRDFDGCLQPKMCNLAFNRPQLLLAVPTGAMS